MTIEGILKATRPRRLGWIVIACGLSMASGSSSAFADPEPNAVDDSASFAAPMDSTLAAPDVATPDTLAPATTQGPNPRPTTTRKVRLIRESRNVVRSGPGEEYAIVAVLPGKTSYPVIAKRGEWYGIRLSSSETGWIHSSLVREFDDLSDLEFRPNPKLYSRTGSFLVAAYTGGYAFDRKSNSLVLGARLGYYVFDRVQVEGGLGWTHVHRPAEIVETLFGLSLESEDFHMLYYHLIGSFEVLPGRQMVPFVSGGVGSAIMKGESEPSYNFGAGTTLYLSKRTAMRWEIRDYVFDTGSKNARRTNHNVEFSLGTLLLF
jgi:outer membrane beta-barrel protein